MRGKSPGLAPLGHSPFGKEKLEGPKRKHDDHGSDASRPAMNNSPSNKEQHWERQYNPGMPSENMRLVEGADFNPKRGRDRRTTHLKVNETDH